MARSYRNAMRRSQLIKLLQEAAPESDDPIVMIANYGYMFHTRGVTISNNARNGEFLTIYTETRHK